ncbi:MAG TPA: hypothetical protein VFJ57_01950 [Solirubrobacterales bacterium]|nr:hypothetical protein [Solirubrobacterales bacterium]
MDRRRPPGGRGKTLLEGRSFDWTLALAAVAIGILIYLLDDRTNWSNGFGFDGRFYGELAKNFPQAVFGHGQVTPPGLGEYTGPHLTGVDSYYAYRWLPSGLVWLGLQVTALSPTDGHVVGMFAALDALMYGLATFCWCRAAGLLGLGRREKLVGAIGLVVSFAVLRTGGYYPVLTDQVALGLGALSFYLWLRGNTVALAICVVAACFTWPFHIVIGPLLLLFPPPPGVRGAFASGSEPPGPSWREWRPARFPAAVGAVIGLATLAALIAIQLGGYESHEGTEQLPLFPLSALIVAAYFFAVFALLLPQSLAKLVAILRSIRLGRLAWAVGVVAFVLVAGRLIAARPGFATTELFKDAFWSTTLDPGIFIVVLVSYWGILILALLADLPRAAAVSWRLGPAMAAVVGAGLLGVFTTQPREIVDVIPFLLLPGVLAYRRLCGLSDLSIVVFFWASLLLSRIWLPIGDLSTNLGLLQDFPAQKYYMTLGAWTPPSTYAMQLGGVLAIGAAMWLLARSRRSGATADP